MIEQLLRIRMAISQFYEEFKEGMDWYVQEMNRLKGIIEELAKEISQLKEKLNDQTK